VAKIHNKAAQLHKHELQLYQRRYFGWLLTGLVIAGFAAGWAFAHYENHWVMLCFIAATIGARGLLYLMEKRWDSGSKEKLKYFKGGQIEGYVAWMLDDLPDTFHVFNNVIIRPDQDLDHIVIGPTGVWAISTKSGRGFLTTSHKGDLILNNEPTDWSLDASRQAMRLRDLLSEPLAPTIPWINAVLAAPLTYTKLINPVKNVAVLSQHNLVEHIGKSHGTLSASEVKRIVAVIEKMPRMEPKKPTPAAAPSADPSENPAAVP